MRSNVTPDKTLKKTNSIFSKRTHQRKTKDKAKRRRLKDQVYHHDRVLLKSYSKSVSEEYEKNRSFSFSFREKKVGRNMTLFRFDPKNSGTIQGKTEMNREAI